MSAILINADSGNIKILMELARKLGGEVTKVSDDQLEDLLLGNMMDKEKTGENISRDSVMALLSKKNEG